MLPLANARRLFAPGDEATIKAEGRNKMSWFRVMGTPPASIFDTSHQLFTAKFLERSITPLVPKERHQEFILSCSDTFVQPHPTAVLSE
jgi:hypothetical protein